jgi:hypothetical protein
MTDPKISRSQFHSRSGEIFAMYFDRTGGKLAELDLTGAKDAFEMQRRVEAEWPPESVRAVVFDNRFFPPDKIFDCPRFEKVLARPRQTMRPPADHFPSRRLFQGRAF